MPETSLEQALQKVITQTNIDPQAGAPHLEELLQQLLSVHQAALIWNRDLQVQRAHGLLVLARAWLVLGDQGKAERVIEEALHNSLGSHLMSAYMGPALDNAVQKRRRDLFKRGRANLTIRCLSPCERFINEQLAPETISLPLGTYRVVVYTEGSRSRSQTEAVLEKPNQTVSMTFPTQPNTAVTLPVPELTPRVLSLDYNLAPRERLLPLWAELTMTVGGAVLAGTGAGLAVLDGRCTDDPATQPTAQRPAACQSLFRTGQAGTGLIVSGSIILTTSLIALLIDRSRTRKHERRSRRSSFASTHNVLKRSITW